MENEKPKNPPAFPVDLEILKEEGQGYYYDKGMTLLDYFAAKALNGILSNVADDIKSEQHIQTIVTNSYNIAKCMLKEREKYI